MSDSSSVLSRITNNVVLRVVLYYAALYVVARLLWSSLPHLPAFPKVSLDALTGAVPAASGKHVEGTPMDQDALAATVAMAMISAVLLSLPVAWVYILTRSKRGYQQSVVHTLIVLPLAVTGIVVLVKYSVALAFGLAGIVAAVRFRNTLEDSKDAVYIFLAVGIGLAAAVEVPVAFVISALFNAVVLALWFSDFGRTPAHFEGKIAERRKQRAMEALSRTGSFVARLDKDLFEDMSAEQLNAVADRAWRRMRRNNPEEPDSEGKREALLRIRTYDVNESRTAVEPMFEDLLKKWKYGGVVHEADGTHIVEYTVFLKKSKPAEELLETLRAQGAPHVVGAEIA